MTGSKAKELVLLLGFSRSGTTWLAKVLDSVPSVYLVSEPDKRTYQHVKLGSVPHCVDPSDANCVSDYKDGLNELQQKFYLGVNSIPFFQKEFIRQSQVFVHLWYLLFLANYPVERLFGLNMHIPCSLLLKKNHELPIRIVWKSTNQSSNIRMIIKAFPGIKIIYLMRNPFAAISSALRIKRMSFDGEDYRRICDRKSAPFFASEHIDFDRLKSEPEIKKRALLWRIECESALAVGQGYEHFKCLLYKDLVSDPQGVVSELFDWLGWDMPAQTQKFLMESTGQVKPPLAARLLGSRFFGVYRGPGGNVNGWKKRLSTADYEAIYDVVSKSPLFHYWEDDSKPSGLKTG